MAYQFKMPDRVILGENALSASEAAMKALGTKALIVTGKNVTKSGVVKLLTDCLTGWGIAWELFNDITGEPTVAMIAEGVKAYRKSGCDFLIGIGGGSPLDSVKAIAAMSVLGGKISDYMGKEIDGKFPPMALIPTTAGTGSETTRFTIITDTEKDVKMLLKGDALMPQLAVVDAAFTRTAPQNVVAATGMDALTHAVESYTSRKANPLADLYALDAIKRIFAYLPAAYNGVDDEKAKEEMSVAAFLAGVCINNASVTLVHGMSRPIGALFHVPHGISNAMLITECLSFAMDGCYPRFAAMARAVGAADTATPDKEAAAAFLSALRDLTAKLGIPTLKGYGIDEDRYFSLIDKMAGDAMASGSPSNTIKELQKQDLVNIYHLLWTK